MSNAYDESLNVGWTALRKEWYRGWPFVPSAMPSQKEIQPGTILRVISSHGLGAPRGSVATVKSIETSHSGDWLAVIEYKDVRQPTHGTRLYRSHLWAADLGRFEIVTDMQRAVSNQVSKAEARRAAKRAQLGLPFEEDIPDSTLLC
jgi:hypothetical protein